MTGVTYDEIFEAKCFAWATYAPAVHLWALLSDLPRRILAFMEMKFLSFR